MSCLNYPSFPIYSCVLQELFFVKNYKYDFGITLQSPRNDHEASNPGNLLESIQRYISYNFNV